MAGNRRRVHPPQPFIVKTIVTKRETSIRLDRDMIIEALLAIDIAVPADARIYVSTSIDEYMGNDNTNISCDHPIIIEWTEEEISG